MDSKKLNSPISLQALFVNVIFTLFYFFYFFTRLDAKLYYQAQQPVFYVDGLFCRPFLAYPGGPIELLSNFVSQFLIFSWSGALLMTLLFGLVALASFFIFRIIVNETRLLFLPWLPTLFFFAWQHDYEHSLAPLLGFFIATLAAFFFLRFVSQKLFIRIPVFTIFYMLLYVMIGGPVLQFVLIILFYDVFISRPVPGPLVYLLLALCVPFIGQSYFFIQPLVSSYFIHLGGVPAVQAWPILLALLTIPILIVITRLSYWKLFISISKKKSPTALVLAAKLALVAMVLVLISTTAFEKKQKAMWQMDYHAQHHEWRDVLDVIQREKLLDTYIGQFQLNRALYHSGYLCESMFGFPQPNKSDGLFLHASVRHLFPLQYSDLFFDLGLINEAQHWAHEALSVTGDTPRNLQRLAEVNILKGEDEAARLFLRRLQKNLWYKKWATGMLAAMPQSVYAAYPYMAQKKTLMVSDDFLITPMRPQDALEKLLEADDENQMAFEYSMATYMLDGQVGRMIKNIDPVNTLPYRKTPRHLEEAMLMYVANTGRQDFDPPRLGISRETVAAFRDYMAIVKKYNGSPSAYAELAQKYSNTFWFYASYIFKKDS